MTIVIYHNPKCSNSRGCLEILRQAGHEPRVIEYLKTPLTRAELAALLAQMNMRAADLVRFKEDAARELGLTADTPEPELVDAMAAHPMLMNRPIVVTNKGAKLCRPPQTVREIL